jgi:hypothetical protein
LANNSRRWLAFCLNSDLTVAWANTYGTGASGWQTAKAIEMTPGGNPIITGFIPDGSANETYVATLSSVDGSVVTARKFPGVPGSTGSYVYSIDLRPEGGYLIAAEGYDGPLLYGYGHYIGLSDALTIDYSFGVSSYGDSKEVLNYCYPYGDPAFSSNHMILGHLVQYGTFGWNYDGSGYLITPTTDVAITAPGRFGPDPKTVFSVPATITTSSLTATAISLSGGGGGSVSSTSPTITTAGASIKHIGWSWRSIPVPPSLSGATPVILGAITYSQSSVYPGLDAAAPAVMQNGNGNETLQTGTDYVAGNNWIQMDLGAKRLINNVIIGCDYTSLLPGGFGPIYTENAKLIYSEDGLDWFNVIPDTVGAFASPLKTISGLNIAGRYIRLNNPGDYVAVTEFYATTD